MSQVPPPGKSTARLEMAGQLSLPMDVYDDLDELGKWLIHRLSRGDVIEITSDGIVVRDQDPLDTHVRLDT